MTHDPNRFDTKGSKFIHGNTITGSTSWHIEHGANHGLVAVDGERDAVRVPRDDTESVQLACDHAALKIEAAHLRKELEAAKNAGERECRKQFEEQVAQLRSFSEDQARQIQKLEAHLGKWRFDFHQDEITIARLTRELEKAKRGKS